MKFKKPSEKTAISALATLGGVGAGTFLGKGVLSVIHTPKAGATAEEQKKENTAANVKRAVIILAGGLVAACVDGTDTLSQFAKAAGAGMAAGQVLDLVSQKAASSSALAADKPMNRFIKAGLACPGYDGALNGGRGRRRALREPFVYDMQNGYQPEPAAVPLNAFEEAYALSKAIAV